MYAKPLLRFIMSSILSVSLWYRKATSFIVTNGPVTDPQASSTFLGTSADVFLTVTNNAAMYIRTVQWVGRLTMMEKAGMEEAADAQKCISSDAWAPNIRRLPLDAPVTKAISWDESEGLSLISSTSYMSLMSDNTMGTDLLKFTMTQFRVARGPIFIVICNDVVNSCCPTILKNNVVVNFLTNE